MDRLLEEHRKQVGDFSAIDWADTAAIEHMRDHGDVTIPVDVTFSWEYGAEAEELRRLYEKGKHGQWNAEEDIDWENGVISKDEWVLDPEGSLMGQLTKMLGLPEAEQKAAVYEELNYGASQILHAEQAALLLCGQLTNVCRVMDEKFYAASQTIDEARHVEAFAKFIERKMDKFYPMSPTVRTLVNELLAADTLAKKTLGMQTIFEGVALGAMDNFVNTSPNPFWVDLIRRVQSDEARHSAFGVLVMRRLVPNMSDEEKADLEDWSYTILEALNACQKHDILHQLGGKYNIDPDVIISTMTSLPEYAEYNSRMYMHAVVPNLRNLGLLTERTEQKYRDIGLIWGKRGDHTGWSPAEVLAN